MSRLGETNCLSINKLHKISLFSHAAVLSMIFIQIQILFICKFQKLGKSAKNNDTIRYQIVVDDILSTLLHRGGKEVSRNG